jgi:predicted nucleic acid-binding protein
MTGLSKCVLDASVGIKLLVKEDLSDAAESLFEEVAASPEIRHYVPDLFFVECANVLWKYVLRYGHSQEDACRNLSCLYALSLTHIQTPTLTPAALRIAMALSISVYDACYVAAADLVKAPLVTADERLVKRLANTKYQACHLRDLTA